MTQEKELIKVTENNGRQAISGRELHDFLEIETQYTKWFSRMCEYGFVENKDYTAISQKRLTAQGNKTTYIDHAIDIDMAKEISMLQRNKKGKQARQYFISIEKEYKLQSAPDSYMIENPVERAEKWIAEQKAAQDKVIKLETTIKKQAPKVEYHDHILKADGTTYTATQIAKEYGTSASKLNNLLNELKFIYKSNGQWVLYSKFQNFNLIETETKENVKGYVYVSTRWTERGREAIHLLLSKKDLLGENHQIDWGKVEGMRNKKFEKFERDLVEA
ncbi:antA/AntB antirepressor family protein [Liquorilactobacillus mali]|uniref:antA/AntB antirepressor family protein n=1 Tax=Liquorilactobacillus mali TaxID=1618 RepID=UPI00265456C6|nr:antA/AntB antirepressor family protein [Liquorilactobacillus mali]MDN7145162.1 antA/AntB antirepressor family protein [Liquorilactobacillus mali]